jgi:cell division septation protein DedD
MRFEVKAGGVAAILFAMTLLSGAVFVLGLLAGYEVGRQAQIDTAQLATSYPLQSAPSSAVQSSESAAGTGNQAMQPAASATVSSAAGASTPVTAVSTAGGRSLTRDSFISTHGPSQQGATPARPRLASNSAPSATEPSSSADGSSATDEGVSAAAESENGDVDDASSQASGSPPPQATQRVASTAPSARHKPYNIQIEAAMDISGADQMMARLKKLGYPSHLVPTEIAGQRWYKVEVGPYATAEEATDAEAELRRSYDSTYGGVARDGSHSHPEAAPEDNPEE